ncbi:MAG: hypothetical protein ACE5HW_00900 [Candidatus Methanofastidiosia archaeon]
MKRFAFIVLSIMVLAGCMGQEQKPDYQTEEGFVKNKGWNENVSKQYFSLDTDNKAQNSNPEKDYTSFIDDHSDYADCIGGTEDIRLLIEFLKQNFYLTDYVLQKCLTNLEYIKNIDEFARHESKVLAKVIENEWDLKNPVYQRALELGLGYDTAVDLAFVKEGYTQEDIYSLKNLNQQIRRSVIYWFGSEIDEDESNWLKLISENPDLKILFTAYFRGNEKGEVSKVDELYQIASEDEFVWDNIIIDLKETYKSTIFIVSNKLIVIDEDGDGKPNRRYIDADSDIPGIDTIDTYDANGKTFYEVNEVYHTYSYDNPKTKLKRFIFDTENGNGHVVKLAKYKNKIENKLNQRGNAYITKNTYAEQQGWIWIDIRDFGVIYEPFYPAFMVLFEINEDNDEEPEYYYEYFPPEEWVKMGPFAAEPNHGAWYEPNTHISIRVFEHPVEGLIILRGWATSCYVPNYIEVYTAEDYKKCYKGNKPFKKMTDIFWTIFWSKWPQEVWEENKPPSIV